MLSIRPTQLRVDLSAIRHNVREVAEAAAPAKVLAVVKANAYGHGAVQVSQAALEAGADMLAVALIERIEIGERDAETGEQKVNIVWKF